ncbi:hypothetical protein CI238_13019, partial [Colletotrichum incanum]
LQLYLQFYLQSHLQSYLQFYLRLYLRDCPRIYTMVDSVPDGLTLSPEDYESLFSVNHDIAKHSQRLESAQAFLAIRRDCENFGNDLVTLSWDKLKRKHRDTFRSGVQHIIEGSPEGQVLLPLVHGKCAKCVDVLIVACSVLSKGHLERVKDTGLEQTLPALLKTTIKTKAMPKLRTTFIKTAKNICGRIQGPNAELLGIISRFHVQDQYSPVLGNFIESEADSLHDDCRCGDGATSSGSRKRRRQESDSNIRLNAIQPLRFDPGMLRALEEKEDDWSEALSNETSHQVRSSIQQFSASRANLVQGVFEGCAFQQALEGGILWKKERADGSSLTNCITAHIPNIEGQDITFVIRVAQDPGFAIIRYLQFQESVELAMKFQ